MEASNEDQALMNNIRKKDMINNLNVILTFVIIEPLDWRPPISAFLFPAVSEPRRRRREVRWPRSEMAANENGGWRVLLQLKLLKQLTVDGESQRELVCSFDRRMF